MIINIDTSNNSLLSTDRYAYATGSITQDSGENDFSSVKNLSSTWSLRSALESAEADTAVISVKPVSGDFIVVRYNDNLSLLDINNVTYILDPLHTPMTSNSEPEGKVSGTYTTEAWKAFDNDNSTFIELAEADSQGSIYYQFKDNEQYKIYEYFLKTGDNSGTDYSLNSGWIIEGSLDGSNWATIGSYQGEDNINKAITGDTFRIQSPGYFEYYRLTATSTNVPRIYTFNLLDPSKICTLDTTSITNGGTIDSCFVCTEKIFFNDYESIKLNVNWTETSLDGSRLNIKINHQDNNIGDINTNIIDTKVEINTLGNEFLGLDSDLWKNTNKPS